MAHVMQRRAEGQFHLPPGQCHWLQVHGIGRRTAASVARFTAMEECGIVEVRDNGVICIRFSPSKADVTWLVPQEGTKYGLYHARSCKSDNCVHIHAYQVYLGLERVRINAKGAYLYVPECLKGGTEAKKFRYYGGARQRHDGWGEVA